MALRSKPTALFAKSTACWSNRSPASAEGLLVASDVSVESVSAGTGALTRRAEGTSPSRMTRQSMRRRSGGGAIPEQDSIPLGARGAPSARPRALRRTGTALRLGAASSGAVRGAVLLQANRLQRRSELSGFVAHHVVAGDDTELQEAVVAPALDLACLEQRAGEKPSRSDLNRLSPEIDRLETVELAFFVPEVVRCAGWTVGMRELRLRELTDGGRAPALHRTVGEERTGEILAGRHRHRSLAERHRGERIPHVGRDLAAVSRASDAELPEGVVAPALHLPGFADRARVRPTGGNALRLERAPEVDGGGWVGAVVAASHSRLSVAVDSPTENAAAAFAEQRAGEVPAGRDLEYFTGKLDRCDAPNVSHV